jgi:dipeptidyl aminopeptidase/acylaminoacyl peptidase
MIPRIPAVVSFLLAASPVAAQTPKAFDAAAAFGARPSVAHLRLSPDGMNVAYITPAAGQGSVVYTLSLAKESTARPIMSANGNPERIAQCDWVSNERLVCEVYWVTKQNAALQPVTFTRLVAVNADASNPRVLSTMENFYSRGWQIGGGSIIDWLPDEDSAALIERVHLADDRVDSRLGSSSHGLAVDWIDTRSLAAKTMEQPHNGVVGYISDGRGAVRIMAIATSQAAGQATGVVVFSYRQQGSREWQKLSDYNEREHSGFYPVAIDRDLNVVYGFKKKDGRFAVYSIALDSSLQESLIYARPDVDVDGLIRIGRRRRVVGVSYATDVRKAVYFDPAIEKMAASLSKALPGHPLISIVDSSMDESKLLVLAGGDVDPGVYYVFDRNARHLQTFLVVRSQLEGVKLATVQPVSYPAADGTLVPGYLTLPPGQENTKGLPAVVLPHGGPGARDVWGFDWLSQFYASRGFAVLQPNFRGSSGYGDAWFQQNGFKSWRTAIGDVLDAGHWLVAQGIADPAKLGIVGWSYGGYAALQSAVVDPSVFKAVVAIAPVTDLQSLKEEHRNWSNYNLISDYVGDGPHVRAGSPAENADKVKVPVLLFHGALDVNVAIAQSRRMAANLQRAGVHPELVTWDNLDHYLDDSAARTEMLRKSDAFLRQIMGMTPMASMQ